LPAQTEFKAPSPHLFRSEVTVQNGTATCETKLLAPAGTLASLTHYVTPRQTEATERHTKQHRSDATVGNPRNTWAEERPFGEVTPATRTRNRYDPTNIADVPDVRTITIVLSRTDTYIRRPAPRFIVVPVPLRAHTAVGNGLKVLFER
jgi:hypothetical protein